MIDGKPSKIYLLLYNALHIIVNQQYVNNKNYKYRQIPLGITEASFRLLSPFLRQVNLRCSDYTLSLYRGTSFRFTSLKRSLLHLFFVVHPLAEGDIVLIDILHFTYHILPHQVFFAILKPMHFICGTHSSECRRRRFTLAGKLQISSV